MASAESGQARSGRRLGRYTARQYAQRLARRTVGPLLLRLTSSADYDLSNTVVIAGSPRSGTTWLAEVLSGIPRSAILFEPEHVLQVPEARKSGLTWHVMKEAGESWPEGERFFGRVLRGQVLTGWTASHVPLDRAIAPQSWIVKFVDANYLLGWLAAEFPIRRPVLLLRHPCAVIASQFRRGWVLDHAPRLKSFFAKYPEFQDSVDSLRDPVEFSAAHWCMQNYVPLKLAKPWPFVLMTYEQLAADPEMEIERLFAEWQLAVPSGIVERAARPSQTTDLGSSLASGADPTASWQKFFSTEQIERVLAIVRTFGLDFYTEGVMPDSSKLRALEDR